MDPNLCRSCIANESADAAGQYACPVAQLWNAVVDAEGGTITDGVELHFHATKCRYYVARGGE